MNNRIRLMAKAHEAFTESRVTAPEVTKFMELIVQECLDQVDKVRDECHKDGDFKQAFGAAWAGLAIARHFGI